MSQITDTVRHAHSEPAFVTSGYDELRGANAGDGISVGSAGVLDHWSVMQTVLNDPARASTLSATVESLLRENVVTTDSEEGHRPWALDSLPFVINPAEWPALEAGLVQRARLLNRIVADFYGAGTLLRGTLPSALAFANPNYLLPSCGYQAPESTFLTLLAFDVGRSPDGEWRVLSNRTEAPSGLGYALENRMTMSRSVPELFERGSIARLAHFFRAYSSNLQRLAAKTPGEGLAVILSGGPEQSTYFEQAYLGRYLGIPIVEGADLTVRDARVFLKTLEGLKPITLILRQIESADCDPLELKVDSLLGAPGLLAAASSANVAIANAIGSGVVENDAIMSFLPGLCQSLLGEDLLLSSLATWWCGQDAELEHVLGNLDNVVLRNAFSRKPLLASSVDAYMASDLNADDRGTIEARLRAAPYAYVGREPIVLSKVPYWSAANEWRDAPLIMRFYVGATEDGYQVMPGGLARVATEEGDLSKDVWLALDRVDNRTALPAAVVAARRSDRDLPSRTADDLFWLGRYLERTEGAVRLYRSLFRNISGEGEITDQPVTLNLLTRLLASMDYLSPHRARRLASEGRGAVEQELWNILFDPEGEDGLTRVLANVNRTAQQVRERISRDAWRLFEHFTRVPQLRWRVHSVADVAHLLDELIQQLSAVNGQIHENMTRGYGWRFLDSGRRLERTRFVVQVVRELCTREPQQLGALSLLLDVCDSGITHRTRYQATPSLNTVLDLLLVDNSNPRSIAHQLETLHRHFQTMPKDEQENELSSTERLLLATQNEILLADIDKLAGVLSKTGVRTHLNRMLKRVDENMISLQEVVTRTYFHHTLFDNRRDVRR